jgi:hypothetical protein
MDGHVEWIEAMINAYTFWLETFRGRDHLTNPLLRRVGWDKMGLKERGF